MGIDRAFMTYLTLLLAVPLGAAAVWGDDAILPAQLVMMAATWLCLLLEEYRS